MSAKLHFVWRLSGVRESGQGRPDTGSLLKISPTCSAVRLRRYQWSGHTLVRVAETSSGPFECRWRVSFGVYSRRRDRKPGPSSGEFVGAGAAFFSRRHPRVSVRPVTLAGFVA